VRLTWSSQSLINPYFSIIIVVGITVDNGSLFGSMVAVAFQIAFRAEIHVIDVFLFLKNHF